LGDSRNHQDGRISNETIYASTIVLRGEVEDIFVCSNARNTGVGQQLMDQAETRMKALGVQWIKIQSSVKNPKALDFYEHQGYQNMQALLFKPL
jgi:GNAT superfamily N-acetyltransferase